jgi:DNA polymerase iota
MRVDLLEDEEDEGDFHSPGSPQAVDSGLVSHVISTASKRWIAHPKTIRLTTRHRPPTKPDGMTNRTFNRISRSGSLPSFVFNLHEGMDVLVEKLVQETLVPMFHRLHPDKIGWSLSLLNVCVTNMVETATDDGTGRGRDIGRMFKRQEEVLKEWKVEDKDVPPDISNERRIEIATSGESSPEPQAEPSAGNEAMEINSEYALNSAQNTIDEDVEWEDEESEGSNRCHTCGAGVPAFAMVAHQLYHALGD